MSELNSKIKKYVVDNNETIEITVESGSRGTMLLTSVATAGRGIYSLSTNSSGIADGTWLFEASNVSIDCSENNMFKVTNNSGAYIRITIID